VDEVRKTIIPPYQEQVQRLVSAAQLAGRRDGKKRAVVIYGLINIRSFFKARDECERRRLAHPGLFPNLSDAERDFWTLARVHRPLLAAAADELNRGLRQMVEDINWYQPDHFPDVQLSFADTLSKMETSRCELLNEYDAWHPSNLGRSAIAGEILRGMRPALSWLGYDVPEPPPQSAPTLSK